MFGFNRDKQKNRKRIEPRTINKLGDGLDRVSKMRAAAPLEIISTPSGMLFRLAAVLIGFRPGLTTGTVAGGSYSAPVSATIDLLDWSGTAFATNGLSVTAYNCYSNSSVIGSGKLVWIVKIFGDWFIVAADCN